YEADGDHMQDFPASLKTLAACKPIYETLPGWPEDITGSTRMEELPENTRNYLNRIEEITETPIDIVSVGAGRNQTILVRNPFK
ncbi:MAG TPA: adenylosuccinate synthase, partial [Deltaproteobacteria bacterium]|nr:adenylosuccinate synthase [Deltaproteobacteria bacterium]